MELSRKVEGSIPIPKILHYCHGECFSVKLRNITTNSTKPLGLNGKFKFLEKALVLIIFTYLLFADFPSCVF